jgi:translocation and assembly module TamA
LSIVAIATALLGTALAAVPALADDLPYSVEIAGDAGDLTSKIQEASRLFGLVERPPASLSALEKRAENDVTRIRQVIRAEGYYDGSVRHDIDRRAEPVAVTLSVTLGKVYRLEPPTIIFQEAPPEVAGITYTHTELGFADRPPARAVTIVAAENTIVAVLDKRGFPLAEAGEREVIVDHETRTVRATFRILPGPFARFGDVTVTGLDQVDRRYVRHRLKWSHGERYDPGLVQETRRALTESRLFSAVRITIADEVAADGLVPVEISVEEAKPRVIGAGVGYSTDEGIGARGFWEHRNLFGGAESLRLELGGSFIERGASAEFVRPDFLSTNQSFIATANIAQEDTEAFESETIEGIVSIERPLTTSLVGRGGFSIERSFIEENDDEERFTLLGLPLQLRWDVTDDTLDPTRGARATLAVTPFVETLGSNVAFVSARLSPSTYFLLEESHRVVLAGWGSVGTIRGAVTDDLPADKRFFAGGGGSIRGYAFQLVGPLDDADDPLGGRSVLEFGTEVRGRVYEEFGAALFIEGGNVFDSAVPDFEDPLLFGAGFGLRYYTDLGPIRLDVAFPLDRRDVDDAFQLYVSIGQAF